MEYLKVESKNALKGLLKQKVENLLFNLCKNKKKFFFK
jgi:hypothetical protein